jgi:lactate dehydrogenase-like 2-hydroxyacid dehydrogenase
VTNRPIVLATRRLPGKVEAELRQRFDARIPTLDQQLNRQGLQQALETADGILCTLGDRFTAEVLSAYPLKTRILANFGVGTDHIDLAAAAAHDIVVTNTPGVLTDDTADLAMALILMSMRRLSEGEREVRGGRWTGWRPTHLLGTKVTGATLGIVGLGRIGQGVARRAHHGFGMRVLGWGRSQPTSGMLAGIGTEWVSSLDELLATSDVVSLHLPSDPSTIRLIDAKRIAMMKRGGVIVNTARGDLVDDDALIAALISGHLAGAGLDVYRGEPAIDRRYLGMENVSLLPHLGSATSETREAMGMRAIESLAAFFAGNDVPDRVSLQTRS